MSAKSTPTETKAQRVDRVARQLDYLRTLGVVDSAQWNADLQRFGIAPARLSDRLLTLSEAEEWTLGAMSASYALVDQIGARIKDESRPTIAARFVLQWWQEKRSWAVAPVADKLRTGTVESGHVVRPEAEAKS